MGTFATNHMLYEPDGDYLLTTQIGYINRKDGLPILLKTVNPGWQIATLMRYALDQRCFMQAMSPEKSRAYAPIRKSLIPYVLTQKVDDNCLTFLSPNGVRVRDLYPMSDLLTLATRNQDQAKVRLADSIWIFEQLVAFYELAQELKITVAFDPSRFFLDFQQHLVTVLDFTGMHISLNEPIDPWIYVEDLHILANLMATITDTTGPLNIPWQEPYLALLMGLIERKPWVVSTDQKTSVTTVVRQKLYAITMAEPTLLWE